MWEQTLSTSCVIKIGREGYFTIPNAESLSLDDTGSCLVSEFIVGRAGFGQIQFLGDTNVHGLNLDKIVNIERYSVEVYPPEHENEDSDRRLNKPAIIQFFGVPVLDSFIILHYTRKVTGYSCKNRLLAPNNEISYDPAYCSLRFRVDGFSKYSLLLPNEVDPTILGLNSCGASSSNPRPTSSVITDASGEQSQRIAFYTSDKSHIVIGQRKLRYAEQCSEFSYLRSETDDTADYSESTARIEMDQGNGHPFNGLSSVAYNFTQESRNNDNGLDGSNIPQKEDLRPSIVVAFPVEETDLIHSLENHAGEPRTKEASDSRSFSFSAASNLSSSSIHLLDIFISTYLEFCDIRLGEQRPIVLSPQCSRNFLNLVAVSLWESDKDLLSLFTTERHLWTLAEALYGGSDFTLPGLEAFKLDGNETAMKFSEWLRSVLSELYPVNLDSSCDLILSVHETVFRYLVNGNIEKAVEAAEGKDSDLAELLSSFLDARGTTRYELHLQKLMENTDPADTFAMKILLLLSGQMFTDSVSASEGLTWLQCLGIYVFYAIGVSDLSVENLIRVYEDGMFDTCWSAPGTSSNVSPSPLLFDLIQLFLGYKDLSIILNNAQFLKFGIEIRWITLQLLENLQYTVPVDIIESIADEFVTVLNSSDRWEYAAVVLLHLFATEERNRKLRSCIVENLAKTGKMGNSLLSCQEFLVDQLLIPTEWIHEGMAKFFFVQGKFCNAAAEYIESKHFSKAAEIVLNNLLPNLFEGEADMLKIANFLDSVLLCDELDFYRPYAPLFEMMETFNRMRSETPMDEVMMGKLEEDLEKSKLLKKIPNLKAGNVIKMKLVEVEKFVVRSRQNSNSIAEATVVEKLWRSIRKLWGNYENERG